MLYLYKLEGAVCGIDVEHVVRLGVQTPQDPAPGDRLLVEFT